MVICESIDETIAAEKSILVESTSGFVFRPAATLSGVTCFECFHQKPTIKSVVNFLWFHWKTLNPFVP